MLLPVGAHFNAVLAIIFAAETHNAGPAPRGEGGAHAAGLGLWVDLAASLDHFYLALSAL